MKMRPTPTDHRCLANLQLIPTIFVRPTSAPLFKPSSYPFLSRVPIFSSFLWPIALLIVGIRLKQLNTVQIKGGDVQVGDVGFAQQEEWEGEGEVMGLSMWGGIGESSCGFVMRWDREETQLLAGFLQPSSSSRCQTRTKSSR